MKNVVLEQMNISDRESTNQPGRINSPSVSPFRPLIWQDQAAEAAPRRQVLVRPFEQVPMEEPNYSPPRMSMEVDSPEMVSAEWYHVMTERYVQAETDRRLSEEQRSILIDQFRQFRMNAYHSQTVDANEIARLQKKINSLQRLIPGPGKRRRNVERDDENRGDPPTAM
mgnify:CR=1 FL=1